ncbi:hypothetical protein Tco_0399533, partial [Tanacetum coccineum]
MCILHLSTISEAILTEAEQLKIITKRSCKETHSSHASGSGADEGTGKSSEDDQADDKNDNDENAEDDQDDDKNDDDENAQEYEDDDKNDDDENAQDDDKNDNDENAQDDD